MLDGRAVRCAHRAGESGGGAPGGGRDGLELGGDVGPDEQDAAGGVIDDKARVGAEAARSEPLAVAVAGQDERETVSHARCSWSGP